MLVKKGWNKNIFPYFIVSFIAVLIFIYLYSYRVLDPTYTDWLLYGGDLSQHYCGWRGYRLGNWQFPIGLTNQLSYPDYISVIFTDSIPIFAVLFKILSPLLPGQFQYFGLWGIMCFILTGIISSRILSYYSKSKLIVCLTSVFFLLYLLLLFFGCLPIPRLQDNG